MLFCVLVFIVFLDSPFRAAFGIDDKTGRVFRVKEKRRHCGRERK